MLDGLFMLLTLSTVMAIASFLAGSLPLTFPLSQSRLRLISTVGMGVLVGTSLIVIIPEGVDTLYSAGDKSVHIHSTRAISPSLTGSWSHAGQGGLSLFIREIGLQPGHSSRDDLPGSNKDSNIGEPDVDEEETTLGTASKNSLGSDDAPGSSPDSLDPSEVRSSRPPHAWIGLSLILGFILMYLLDTLPTLSAPSNSRNSAANIYSLSDLSTTPLPPPPPRALSTTLGLCIHATADGIALGASSSSTSTTSLSLIIFVAIMVHKAPAAFGLTAVLLKQGLSKRGARAHLIAFSLAAPIGAVGTWVVVRTLGGGSGEEESMRWWTGVLLLFSGGTFLYVAMHTMHESDNPSEPSFATYDELPSHNGYLDSGGGIHSRDLHHRAPRDGRSLRLVLAAVVGMLLPLITQIGHAH